jgi:hypothetical protein
MTTPTEPAAREMGLLSRAVGVITSPAETFRSVSASPRPAGILFLVCLLSGLATALPLFTEQGQRSVIEMQVREATRFSPNAPPAQTRQALERMGPYLGYMTLGQFFIIVPVVSILFAGLYWLVFNVVLGGTADFKQVLGVVTHSQVITALGAVLGAPIQYAQGLSSPVGPFHLGALAAGLDPNHPLARLLGALTFFGIWQSIVTAIGLAVVYRRRPVGLAIVLLTLYIALTAFFFVVLPSLIPG